MGGRRRGKEVGRRRVVTWVAAPRRTPRSLEVRTVEARTLWVLRRREHQACLRYSR